MKVFFVKKFWRQNIKIFISLKNATFKILTVIYRQPLTESSNCGCESENFRKLRKIFGFKTLIGRFRWAIAYKFDWECLTISTIS